MKKKVNLKLDDLKVKSFVTALEQERKDEVKGGGVTYYDSCVCSDECTAVFGCTQKIIWSVCHPECVF